MNDDRDALGVLLRESTPGALHMLIHYIYLPTQRGAAEVATELRERGFLTEQRLGADQVNWLVLARHKLIPSEELLAATREAMEGIATNYDGEYDGWEAEVG